MRVDHAIRPELVRWTVLECDFLPDWIGTHPTFTITPVDDRTSELHFRHEGRTPDLDCIDMCTRGWNHFIPSLAKYASTGQGMPNEAPRIRPAAASSSAEVPAAAGPGPVPLGVSGGRCP